MHVKAKGPISQALFVYYAPLWMGPQFRRAQLSVDTSLVIRNAQNKLISVKIVQLECRFETREKN